MKDLQGLLAIIIPTFILLVLVVVFAYVWNERTYKEYRSYTECFNKLDLALSSETLLNKDFKNIDSKRAKIRAYCYQF